VANIFDGWPDTEFEAMPSSTSNYVGVDLSSLRDIAVVSIDAWAHAQDSAPTSLIVEFSADNVTWRTLPTPPGTLSVHIAVPAGTYARYVRMRLTNSQPPWWLAVYDFTVDFRSVS
jgi:hypothetical protein